MPIPTPPPSMDRLLVESIAHAAATMPMGIGGNPSTRHRRQRLGEPMSSRPPLRPFGPGVGKWMTETDNYNGCGKTDCGSCSVPLNFGQTFHQVGKSNIRYFCMIQLIAESGCSCILDAFCLSPPPPSNKQDCNHHYRHIGIPS